MLMHVLDAPRVVLIAAALAHSWQCLVALLARAIWRSSQLTTAGPAPPSTQAIQSYMLMSLTGSARTTTRDTGLAAGRIVATRALGRTALTERIERAILIVFASQNVVTFLNAKALRILRGLVSRGRSWVALTSSPYSAFALKQRKRADDKSGLHPDHLFDIC